MHSSVSRHGLFSANRNSEIGVIIRFWLSVDRLFDEFLIYTNVFVTGFAKTVPNGTLIN